MKWTGEMRGWERGQGEGRREEEGRLSSLILIFFSYLVQLVQT
jgi:hypothetical protein